MLQQECILKIDTTKMDTTTMVAMDMTDTTKTPNQQLNPIQHKNQPNQDTTTHQQTEITTRHEATAEDAGAGKFLPNFFFFWGFQI